LNYLSENLERPAERWGVLLFGAACISRIVNCTLCSPRMLGAFHVTMIALVMAAWFGVPKSNTQGTQDMTQLLTGAPIWVWPLLVVLILVGLRARNERTAPVLLIYG
jgi:hypothetical protein